MHETSSPTLPPTESIPSRPTAESGVPRIVVTQGPSAGKTLLLSKARATVGRHGTNDLVLDDPRVSSAHLELERREAGRVLVRDLGTTNGTWLGPHRIVEAELGPGALVRIGESSVRVEVDDRARPEPGLDAARFGGMIGASAEMRELFAVLDRVAPMAISLLVQGETGTGKQELARAVHARSGRSAGPFVVFDATNVPIAMVDSVLFGHERGAIAGADDVRPGIFERASGGTLLLDEIGELPLAVQSKLLRVLETRAVQRLGGSTPIPVDFRLVASTRRDLRIDIEAGRFREDLYFRISEARVVLPPLRSRPADIAPLARHFASELGAPDRPISLADEAVEALTQRSWPGNVRELRSVLARAAALSEDGVIRPGDVAGEGFGFRGSSAEREPLDLQGTFAEAKGRAIERFERAYLEALLRRCGGNLSKASRQADIARNHLRVLLKKRGLYDPGDT